jgi:hypothetical protein
LITLIFRALGCIDRGDFGRSIQSDFFEILSHLRGTLHPNGVPDWTNDFLRNGVLLLSILAVFGLIPLRMYEFAYQVIVIPWFSKYVRESQCEQVEVSEILLAST